MAFWKKPPTKTASGDGLQLMEESNMDNDGSIYSSHLVDKANSTSRRTSRAPDPDGHGSPKSSSTPLSSNVSSAVAGANVGGFNGNATNSPRTTKRTINIPKRTKSYPKSHKKSFLRCSIELILLGFLFLVAIMVAVNFSMVLDSRYNTSGNASASSTSTGGTTGGSTSQQQQQQQPKPAAVPRIRQGGSNSNPKTNNYAADADNTKYHVVFSTSCSYSHDWQSYLFFFHAMLHSQPGDVTRIVSGCSPEDEATMTRLHKEQFEVMNPNFLIHFTPEFGKQLNDKGFNYQQTKYWNKPFGLRHWLQHRFGYSWDPTGKDKSGLNTPYDDDIIILVDPDSTFLFDFFVCLLLRLLRVSLHGKWFVASVPYTFIHSLTHLVNPTLNIHCLTESVRPSP
jgi:hypothetical protein